MSTPSTKSEYLLLFRGTPWDSCVSAEEFQQLMDKVMAWFEGLQQQGKVKAAQPLDSIGRTISRSKGRPVADGPFAESKEAVGGYLLLRADTLDEAATIARTNPALEYGLTIEVRPVLDECPHLQRAKKQLLAHAAA